ncbi:MAG: hypothetical protein V2B20_14130 [Pseudomonadota bacterium]
MTEIFEKNLPQFADENSRGKKDKTMYQCLGCGNTAWGKAGLGVICECGGVLVEAGGEPKAGLAEKVYRLLAKRYGNKDKT